MQFSYTGTCITDNISNWLPMKFELGNFIYILRD